MDELLADGYDLRREVSELGENDNKISARGAKEIEKMEKTDIDGSIFIKAEWDGYGEQMPPARSESIFNNQNTDKNRNHFTKQEQHTMF